MHCCNESSGDQRFIVRPAVFCESLTFWTVFVFPCHLSVRSAVFDWNAPFLHFLVFSALPFCLVFHSLLSFGQRYCLKETGCIARACVCDCVLVFKCVHKGTTGCISKVMVTNPYLFFFPFSPCLVCVFCYLRKVCMDTSVRRAAEVWRSLSSLSLHRIHLSQQQK